ncbi:MAG: hypothetical protein EBV49_16310, partial [Betaproteobacteria bacterium]|nr:hypothetical protein [Betaproteobacteria bacterium]
MTGVEDQVGLGIYNVEGAGRAAGVAPEGTGGGLRARAGVAEGAVVIKPEGSASQGESGVGLQRAAVPQVGIPGVGVGAREEDGVLHKGGLPLLDQVVAVAAGVVEVGIAVQPRGIAGHQPGL